MSANKVANVRLVSVADLVSYYPGHKVLFPIIPLRLCIEHCRSQECHFVPNLLFRWT